VEIRQTKRFLDSRSASARNATQASTVFADGITRETIRRQPYSPSQAEGRGSVLVDVDGDERVDFLFNHASLIHGHCYPPVADAIADQARRMGAVSFPSGLDERLGRELQRRVTVESARFRFTNSGSEAVMLAVRTACAATGRRKILRFAGCYHGSVLTPVQPDGASWLGTEQLVCSFNSPAEVEALAGREGGSIACVVLDPSPSRSALAGCTPEFLAAIDALRRRHGTLLVLDEVYCSRAAYRGLASRLGLVPDLTCLGKHIGGGLPIGAVAMRPELSELYSSRSGPTIDHGGTFNGNTLTMAAGLACLRDLGDTQIERMNRLTAHLCHELRAMFARRRVDWTVRYVGSLFHLWPRSRLPATPEEARDSVAGRQLRELTFFLLCHGVVLAPAGLGCLATTTRGIDVDYLLAAVEHYLAR
jgi:glutamate-1-semialdehyde 2,1-aminomutase